MDLKEVKLFLESNKDNAEVQAFIQELNPLTIERVQAYLNNDEQGKKWHQSTTDAKITKAIETYKEKTLPNLIQQEREKIQQELNPKETPEQKEVRQLRERQQAIEKELKRTAILNFATKEAVNRKLPVELIEKILGEDEDATIKNIDFLENVYKKAIQNEVAEIFKSTGIKPHQTQQNQGGFYTREQLKSMSQEEIMANLDKVNGSLGKN
jgi:hypothetical protein